MSYNYKYFLQPFGAPSEFTFMVTLFYVASNLCEGACANLCLLSVNETQGFTCKGRLFTK